MCTGIAKIGPPGIRSRKLGISLAKDIHHAYIEKIIKSVSLFESIAVFSFILFRIFQIDRLVRHIEISTKNHRFMRLELRKKIPHCSIPFLSVNKPRKIIFGIWNIGIHEIKIRKFECQCTSFIVCFRADTIHDGERRDFGKNSRTRVARTVCRIIDTHISKGLNFGSFFEYLFWFCLNLLETDNIRIQPLQNLRKSFFHHRSESIHIPRKEFKHKREKLIRLIMLITLNYNFVKSCKSG